MPNSGVGYQCVVLPSATHRIKYCYSRKFVRLACLRHAASVHPEPESNSYKENWACSIKNRNCEIPSGVAPIRNCLSLNEWKDLFSDIHRWTKAMLFRRKKREVLSRRTSLFCPQTRFGANTSLKNVFVNKIQRLDTIIITKICQESIVSPRYPQFLAILPRRGPFGRLLVPPFLDFLMVTRKKYLWNPTISEYFWSRVLRILQNPFFGKRLLL